MGRRLSKPSNSVPNGSELTVIHSYEARGNDDLSVKRNEKLVLIKQDTKHWWYVKRKSDATAGGYVPSNYVAMCSSLESEEWFAGRIHRYEAESRVLEPNLRRGTFLIRQRETDDTQYALTIRDCNTERAPHVRHYKILPLDKGRGFFIRSSQPFHTLKELVAYYMQDNLGEDGLCYQLTFPATRICPTLADLTIDTHHNWNIPKSDITRIRKLGHGNYGEVWYGQWRGRVDVAVKMTKQKELNMTSESIQREAAVMKTFNHPNIVKLYAVSMEEEPFYIITEYMVNGALDAYLRKCFENEMLPDERGYVDMCAQIANGMMYLSSRKVVHRDLAARNILVGEIHGGFPIVKVADFGLARQLDINDFYRTNDTALPWAWLPPEHLQSGFHKTSDVWSFGIVLHEIFTSAMEKPYAELGSEGMNSEAVTEKLQGGFRMSKPNRCPKRIYDKVMLECWQTNREKRPSFEKLFHFFDDYFISCDTYTYIPYPDVSKLSQ